MKRVTACVLFIAFMVCNGSTRLYAQSKLVNIPGTHLSIIPPVDYKLSTNFKGIEKDKNTLIKVYDPYSKSYFKYAQDFTRESLENGGSEVKEYRKMSISGFPAKYASVENYSGGTSFYLVFGDSAFSVMLVGACPANQDSEALRIKKAILSVKYDKNMKIDPLSGTFFNLTDTNSPYRFAKCTDDFYIYSSDGTVKDPYSGESILSILPFTSEYSVGDETIATAIRNSYEQYGITDTKIKKENQVQIGKLSAMEVEEEARIDNKKAVLYRLTLVNGRKAVLFLGIATSDYDKNLEEFRNLAYSLTFK